MQYSCIKVAANSITTSLLSSISISCTEKVKEKKITSYCQHSFPPKEFDTMQGYPWFATIVTPSLSFCRNLGV
jgi:hypothetical protein